MSERPFVGVVESGQAAHPKVKLVLPYDSPMSAKAVTWLSPDDKHKRRFPELEDVENELRHHVPFGKVGRECLLVDTRPPHPVGIFMEQLWPLAESLEQFFDEVVLAPGDKTPMQKLEAARKEGLKLEKAGKPGAAAQLLAPMLAPFAVDPDPKRDTVEDHEETVADAWNSLGVFRENAGDVAGARAAFAHAAGWGESLGAVNYCSLPLSPSERTEAVRWVREYLDENSRKIDREDEAAVRAHAAAWLLQTGKQVDADAMLVEWLKRLEKKAAAQLWAMQRKAALGVWKAQKLDVDVARLDAMATKVLGVKK